MVVNGFELPEAIPEGARNTTLFSYGRSLRAKGADDSEVLEGLNEANAKRCTNPLSAQEVNAIAQSVCTVAPGLSPEYAALATKERAIDISRDRLRGINDKELSRLFGSTYRDRLLYVPEARGWYAFDGRRWVQPEHGGDMGAQRLMKEFSDRLNRAAMATDDDKERASALKAVARYNQRNDRARLLADCESEMHAPVSEFDRDRMMFNCPNCTVDLRTGEPRPHRASDMLTKVAGCDYDPQAGYAEWREFIVTTFDGDEERAAFLQMAVGRALAGDTSLHRFYIANGPTRTGKSSTLEPILAMFGDYGASMQPDTLQEAKRGKGAASSDVARLAGKRFVVCPELPARMRLDVAQMKQWTGGDTVTARYQFQGEFDFRPMFQLWINTNYLPDVTDPTLFASDRCVVLPFDRRIPAERRDTGLRERMTEPAFLSSILSWAIDGWRMAAVADGHMPDACRIAVEEYATDSDRMGEFIADECETGTCMREDGTRLYTRYKDWCESNGYGALGRNNFYGELSRRDGIADNGAGRVDGKYTRHVFSGLAIRR